MKRLLASIAGVLMALGIVLIPSTTSAGTDVTPGAGTYALSKTQIITTTVLGASANQTYGWYDTSNGQKFVSVSVYTDKGGSFVVEYTDDTAKTPYFNTGTTYSVTGGTPLNTGVIYIPTRYWRINYTNGGTAQTTNEITDTASQVAANILNVTATSPLSASYNALTLSDALSCTFCAVKNANNNFSTSQTITGTMTATTFSGSGASLTSIPNAALVNSTISGVALGSNLNTLTFSTHLTGTSYNGSAAVTLGTDATNANTASTIVARDASGNFSAGTVSVSGLNDSGLAISSLICTDASKNFATTGCPAPSEATLTFGAHLTGVSYNGSSAVTIATDATNANTASTIVARDASGNFSAGSITPSGNISFTSGGTQSITWQNSGQALADDGSGTHGFNFSTSSASTLGFRFFEGASGGSTQTFQLDPTSNAKSSAGYFKSSILAAPSAPSLSQSAGGTIAATTYFVKITYMNENGETTGSSEASLAVSANNVLVVSSPSSFVNASGWNVYVSTSTGTETKQNASTTAIGTNWTEPTTGLVAGASIPADNMTWGSFITGNGNSTVGALNIGNSGWSNGDGVHDYGVYSNGTGNTVFEFSAAGTPYMSVGLDGGLNVGANGDPGAGNIQLSGTINDSGLTVSTCLGSSSGHIITSSSNCIHSVSVTSPITNSGTALDPNFGCTICFTTAGGQTVAGTTTFSSATPVAFSSTTGVTETNSATGAVASWILNSNNATSPTGDLFDLQLNGVNKLQVLNSGGITSQGPITATQFNGSGAGLTSATVPIAALTADTISGVALGGTLNTLTFGTHLTGTSYNGSSAVTIATDATNANTANTIVARDASGNFNAGAITAATLTATTEGIFGSGSSGNDMIALKDGCSTGNVTFSYNTANQVNGIAATAYGNFCGTNGWITAMDMSGTFAIKNHLEAGGDLVSFRNAYGSGPFTAAVSNTSASGLTWNGNGDGSAAIYDAYANPGFNLDTFYYDNGYHLSALSNPDGTWTSNALAPPGNAPVLGQSAGGTLAATTYYVKYTYNNSYGESMPSAETSLAVSLNNVLTVNSPGNIYGGRCPGNLTTYNVYVSTSSGTETKQVTGEACNTTWTEPTTGLIAGSALPTANTAYGAFLTASSTYGPYSEDLHGSGGSRVFYATGNGQGASEVQFGTNDSGGADEWTWYVNGSANASGLGTHVLDLYYLPNDTTNGCCLPAIKIVPSQPSGHPNLNSTNGDIEFVPPIVADGTITSSGVMYATAFVNSSLRSLKRDIHPLKGMDAINILKSACWSSFKYKKGKQDTHYGFVADCTPALLSKNHTGFDAETVATFDALAIIQEDDKVQELQAQVASLQHEVASLQKAHNETPGQGHNIFWYILHPWVAVGS